MAQNQFPLLEIDFVGLRETSIFQINIIKRGKLILYLRPKTLLGRTIKNIFN